MTDPTEKRDFARVQDSMNRAPGGGRGLLAHTILAPGVIEEIVEKSKAPEDTKTTVLILGAGRNGLFERELIEHVRKEGGYDPTLIVTSPTFAKDPDKTQVQQGIGVTGSEAAVLTDDFSSELATIPDGFCDYVLSVNVFQHIPHTETEQSIREIVRVLKVGGTAVITPLLISKDVAELMKHFGEDDAVAWSRIKNEGVMLAEKIQEILSSVCPTCTLYIKEIPRPGFLLAQGAKDTTDTTVRNYKSVAFVITKTTT